MGCERVILAVAPAGPASTLVQIWLCPLERGRRWRRV